MTKQEAVKAFADGKKVQGKLDIAQGWDVIKKYSSFDFYDEYRLAPLPPGDLAYDEVVEMCKNGEPYEVFSGGVWYEPVSSREHDPDSICESLPHRRKPVSDPDAVTGDMVTAAKGKGFQYRIPVILGKWVDCGEGYEPWPTNSHYEYRRKPETRMVPLGPEDITPGTVIRSRNWPEHEFAYVTPLSDCVAFVGLRFERQYSVLQREGCLWKQGGQGEWRKCEKEEK